MMFNIFNFTVSINKMSDDNLCLMEMESSRVKEQFDSVKDKYLYDTSLMFIVR